MFLATVTVRQLFFGAGSRMIRHSRRPLRITLLLGLVLITTALNAIRMLTAIAWRSTLGMFLPPWKVEYIAISGGAWTLGGLFLLWCLVRGGGRTGWLFVAAAVAYAAWAWADRLLVQFGPQANWRFSLILTIVLLAFTAFVALDPRNQIHFRKGTYDR